MKQGERATKGAARRRFVAWVDWLATFVQEGWPSILFSSALVLIIEHLGALTVVSKLSLLLVSNLAAHQVMGTTNFSQGPYVIAITEADFQGRYRERSPLDHCLLAGDLQRVLERHPSRLAVDIDVSPPSAPDASERACQTKLDTLLDRHARQVVLISPEPVASVALRREKIAWMQARCAEGVQFASPYLERSLRMVIDQRRDARRSLAMLALHGGRDSLCVPLGNDPGRFADNWLDSAGSRAGHLDNAAHREPINFAVAARTVPAALPADAPGQWPVLAGRIVFFGGTWGHDDTYTTPIGRLSGVWIHAARMVTLEHPVHALHPWVGFVIDIVTGFAFALMISGFWKLYIGLRIVEFEEAEDAEHSILCFFQNGKGRGKRRLSLQSSWSSVALISFVLAYGLLCLSFFFVARYVFVSRGVLIAPLLMAAGMLMDGFMSGPVEVLTEKVRKEHGESVLATSDEQRRWLRQWAIGALGLVMLFALGFMALVDHAAYPGAWLTVILLGLLLLIFVLVLLGFALRRRASVRGAGEREAHSVRTTVRARRQPDSGRHRLIAGLGKGVAVLRSIIFLTVILYAISILFMH